MITLILQLESDYKRLSKISLFALYLLNLKRPSSVFKQAPLFKEGFNKQKHN
ncbi:hypothetical protein OUG_0904 [Helicobacter pylori R32b]|nr:hypothetical protein OUG_0904 [Helicobacter pylori R32b]